MYRIRNLPIYKQILLISLDWCRPKDPKISLPIGSIAATLNKIQVHNSVLSYNVNSRDFKVEQVISDVFERKPTENTLVGLGAYVWCEDHVQKISQSLKAKKFRGKVLIGGPQISYTGQNLTNLYPEGHIFVRGYVENALSELVLKSTAETVCPNIVGVDYLGKKHDQRQAFCDLSPLPSPYLNDVIPANKFLRLETSRGCPFRCAFCQHKESALATSGGWKINVRQHFKTSRIDREIEWICKNEVSDLAIIDPTFNSGPNYLRILEKFLENSFRGKLSLQCRFEMVKDEFLSKVKNLQKFGANVVLEFGLQTANQIEAKAINRPNNLRKVSEIIEKLNDMAIPFEVSLIYGLPLQTVESFENSVKFCTQRNVPVIRDII